MSSQTSGDPDESGDGGSGRGPAGVLLDRQGRVLSVSKGCAGWMRVAPEEAVGRPIEELVPQTLAQGVRENLRDALETGGASRIVKLIDERGTKRYLELVSVPLLTEAGGAHSISCVLRDVSDQRLAVNSLRLTEAHLHAIFETATDAIVSIDISGEVEAFNRAAERIFSRRAREVIGRPFTCLFPAEEAAALELRIARYATGGEGVALGPVFETRGRHQDGTAFPMRLGMAEARVNGFRKITCIVHDLTAENRLAEELRQAQKMEAIARLSGGVAHDFKNLLTGIRGCIDIARSRLADEHPSSEPLEMAWSAVQRGVVMGTQLLALSRPKPVKPRPVDIRATLEATEGMLRRLVGEHVRLDTDVEPARAIVLADPGHVEQILLNLVVNARDAMPQGGKILVGIQEADPDGKYSGRADSGWMTLLVRDTGCGMDSETLARAFEPFFTTKPEGVGTGLGLSTVYGIVKQIGGHLRISSEVDVGTEVRCYFPRIDLSSITMPERGSDHPETWHDHGSGEDKTVLVVEDDEVVLVAVQHYLEQAGYRTLAARDPRLALRILQEHPEAIDVLLTDVQMPDLSGPDLASRFLEARPEGCVLFMSALPREALEHQWHLPPDAICFEKPFEPGELTRTIRELSAA